MENIVEKKINCPYCGSANCFQEDHTVQEQLVESFLCLACGYTATSLNQEGSDFVAKFEEGCPELFKDIKFVDPETNLVWYPTVLNFPEHGLVFPDGTDAFDWKWRAVPIISIPEEDRQNYPIPGEEGKYYENKADMPSSKMFEKNEFQEACKYLNIIQTIEQP